MGQLLFKGDKIAMNVRIAMIDLFEPWDHLFQGNIIVDFNNAMRTTAGTANITYQTIKLNADLFKRNPDAIMQTFAHELAHLLTYKKHKRPGIKPHGPEWIQIMRDLGYKPTRTHSLDVTHIKRRWPRVEANCACKTHMITMHQVKKMQRGSNYICTGCKQYLKINIKV
jgi:SprT protein